MSGGFNSCEISKMEKRHEARNAVNSRSWEQASIYSRQDNETSVLQLQENEF